MCTGRVHRGVMSTLTSDNLRDTAAMRSTPEHSPRSGSVASSRAQSSGAHSSDHSSSTITEVSRSSTPAISQFDQSYADSNTIDIDDLDSLDPASTVIDGKISFVLGCTRQPLKHVFKTSPAHVNPKMASNYLTAKIDNFLKNTDHTMNEWQQNTSAAKANIKRVLRRGGTPDQSHSTRCTNADDADDHTIADGDWDEVNNFPLCRPQRHATYFVKTSYNTHKKRRCRLTQTTANQTTITKVSRWSKCMWIYRSAVAVWCVGVDATWCA